MIICKYCRERFHDCCARCFFNWFSVELPKTVKEAFLISFKVCEKLQLHYDMCFNCQHRLILHDSRLRKLLKYRFKLCLNFKNLVEMEEKKSFLIYFVLRRRQAASNPSASHGEVKHRWARRKVPITRITLIKMQWILLNTPRNESELV